VNYGSKAMAVDEVNSVSKVDDIATLLEAHMQKPEILFYLAVALILAGCVPNAQTPIATKNEIIITASAGFSEPLLYNWNLGKDPLITTSDNTLGILGIQLSERNTKIFYSLSGSEITQLLHNTSIELVDNFGGISNLINIVPLGKTEEFELGILNFKTRSIGPTELYLNIVSKTGENDAQKILVASFDGPASDDLISRTTSARRENGVKLSGSTIEMYLWLATINKPTEAPSSQTTVVSPSRVLPTSEPVLRKPWVETKNGGEVVDEYSIGVENHTTKHKSIFAFQLLSSDDVITSQNGLIEVHAPIIVETPKTVATPYP
jgi:hypothetical protein